MTYSQIRLFFTTFLIAIISPGSLVFGAEKLGGAPLYVALEGCPAPARLVITSKRLPRDQIHACSAEPIDFRNTTASLVQLDYGPAEDCPSGCFYKHFTAVITPGNPMEISELPGPSTAFLARSLVARLVPDANGKPDLHCDTATEELFDFEIVSTGPHTAWQATLKQPFGCQWSGGKSKTTGSYLLYLKDGETVIAAKDLTTKNEANP